MKKTDALIIQILAKSSSNNLSSSKITAPEGLYEAVKTQFVEAEEKLKELGCNVSVEGGRGTQKKLTWVVGEGLYVHDYGASGGRRPLWSEVPDTVLLAASVLLPKLLDHAYQYKTSIGANNLEVGAEAVLAGVDLPLLPEAKPSVRKITKEEDAPMEPVEVDEEADDSLVPPLSEDEENIFDFLSEPSEEDEDEEDEDEEDAADLQEIIGTNEKLEDSITDTPELDALLPPTREVSSQKTRGRKKKND